MAYRLADSSVPELEVRHVNIKHAVDKFKGFYGIIAAAVIHQGDSQPLVNCLWQGSEDLGHHMAGSDKINVMTALPLQAGHHGSQLPVTCLDPMAQVADIEILAEDAEQVAIGDKYGS